MSKAATIADSALQRFLEVERSRPVQRNLFTGEPEALRVEVPDQVTTRPLLTKVFHS